MSLGRRSSLKHLSTILALLAGAMLPVAAPALDLIVDNTDAGFSASANWFPSTSTPGYYGSNYQARPTGSVSDPAVWSATIPTTASYTVYARWTADPNRAANASYVVTTATGNVTVTVNQQANNGAWISLGNFNFAAGTAPRVSLSCWTTAGSYVIADAIRITDAPLSSPATLLTKTMTTAPFYNLAPYNTGKTLIYLPAGFRKTAATDYVYYFHGYRTNVSSALVDFKLREQIETSGRNVVLVFPETAVNANDPDGGRLDWSGGFTYLVNEVAQTLANEGYVQSNTVGDIVVAGHSGAYVLVGNVLNLGGSRVSQVKEVYLFDSMYGSQSAFVSFVRNDTTRRLLSIATPSGYGTVAGNDSFRSSLTSYGVSHRFRDLRGIAGAGGKLIPDADLTASRVGVFYDNQDHYLVVHENNNFGRFLKTSTRLDPR